MPDSSTRLITCSSYAPPRGDAPAAGLGLALVGYLGLILIGFIALRLPGTLVRGNELSPTAAVFMAINTATLTGFDPTTTLEQYQPPGQWIVLGLMIGGTLLSLGIGGVAVARIIGLPYRPVRIVAFTLMFYVAAVLGGVILLSDGSRSPLEATFLACSAVGNVGLALGPLPEARAWQTHAILLPLAVLGSLGVPVLIDLWDRLTGRTRCLTRYSTIVLAWTAGLYLAGVLLPLLISQSRAAAIDGAVTVLNARSAGFSFHYADQFARHGQWIVMGLMLIGSASGSAAGGLKVNTLTELWLGTRRALAGVPVGRAFGIALVWAALYLMMATAAQAILVYTEPQIPADRMLFEVFSALGNVGLSFGPVSLVGPGMFILCGLMLLGRFLPLLVLIWMMRTTRDADLAVG